MNVVKEFHSIKESYSKWRRKHEAKKEGVPFRFKNEYESLVLKDYDAEQCSRRRWNEEEQKWERAFDKCAICSYICPQRAEDFAKAKKKRYVDKATGLVFLK